MGLAQRIKAGNVNYYSAAGPSLLESLWQHLLTEWEDPDAEETSEFDAGYTTALAYCIAKIEAPYVKSGPRLESVLNLARQRILEDKESQ